jgi:hypothetical protein
VEPLPTAASGVAKKGEGGVDFDAAPLREDSLRLLDHDARREGALQLRVLVQQRSEDGLEARLVRADPRRIAVIVHEEGQRAVDADQLEQPPGRPARRAYDELVAPRPELKRRPQQQEQRGRVEEGHLGEIHDHEGNALGGGLGKLARKPGAARRIECAFDFETETAR